MQPEFDQPVADYVRFFGSRTPDNIAYVDGGVHCTYHMLDGRASQVANGLRATGVEEGDRIGYLGVNAGAYIEVFFGACKAKAVYVGLNWRLAVNELAYILADANIAVIFCDPPFFDLLHGLKSSLPGLRTIIAVDARFDTWRNKFSLTDPALEHAPTDPVLQLYTSGTTGKPKGVVIANRSMSAHRRSESGWGSWFVHSPEPASGQQDVIINAMPNFHVGGLGWLLMGVFRGARIIVMAAPDADTFLDNIERYQATHLFAVPVVLAAMVNSQRQRPRDIGSLKAYIYGASSIAPSLLKEAIEVMQCNFAQIYGCTETNGTLTLLAPDDHQLNSPERLKSCGRAIAGVQVMICGRGGEELPVGVAGEICIRSPSLMEGYANLPQASAEAFRDGWYRTGDGGLKDPAGFIYMSDRIKDMIVSGGENIYPTEIENALCEHPGVAEVAVVGVPDAKWGESARACVVLKDDSAVSAEQLIDFLRSRLAGYKIPRQYQFLDALPRTPSGKIKKYELRG